MEAERSFLDKLGLVRELIPGYVALTIFTIGEGIDKGWISEFFSLQGLSGSEIGLVIGFYGLVTGIAGWFSGVLTDKWGPRKVMSLGILSWMAFHILFLTVGIRGGVVSAIFTYGLRGVGYPLFVFSFITWIAYVAPKEKMGAAMGWFWFWHTLGYIALSGYLATWMKTILPDITIFWLCIPWIIIGGFIGAGLTRGKAPTEKPPTFREAMGVIKEDYRTGIIGIVRTINTSGMPYALLVFMPLWITSVIGFSMSEWLLVWSTMFLSNTIWNLLWGFIGDRIGWRKVVLWFGGVGCGIFMLLYYYVPAVIGHNFIPLLLVGILAGALLAAYVPLSAIAGTILPTKRGCVMGILNFGASISFFVGSLLGGVIYDKLGITTVIWLFAVLYFGGAGLTLLLPEKRSA